jgi:hypothetical protein
MRYITATLLAFNIAASAAIGISFAVILGDYADTQIQKRIDADRRQP